MRNPEQKSAPSGSPSDDLSPAEADLGKVLALLYRVLPRLDEPARAEEVTRALGLATNYLESARRAHEHQCLSQRGVGMPIQKVSTGVEPEIAAVIAAAVAVLFERPYRLVSVQQVTTPVPHLNVWALEGRTQIFQSHKIR
jgi:hypothetical protein